jgi:hypothetical protein
MDSFESKYILHLIYILQLVYGVYYYRAGVAHRPKENKPLNIQPQSGQTPRLKIPGSQARTSTSRNTYLGACFCGLARVRTNWCVN